MRGREVNDLVGVGFRLGQHIEGQANPIQNDQTRSFIRTDGSDVVAFNVVGSISSRIGKPEGRVLHLRPATSSAGLRCRYATGNPMVQA